MERLKNMSIAYVILKTLMWMLIALFVGDFVMQTISYSFYKGDRKLEQVTFQPEKIAETPPLKGSAISVVQSSV